MKIIIVGTSGSGQVTLARKISQKIGADHIELDAIYHKPNWQPIDTENFNKIVNERIAKESWVVCPEARSSDLKQAFRDTSINGIICAIGGDDTYRTIPLLLEDSDFIQFVRDDQIVFFKSRAFFFVFRLLAWLSYRNAVTEPGCGSTTRTGQGGSSFVKQFTL